MSQQNSLSPLLQKNDKLAYRLIAAVSAVVFIAVVILGRVELQVELGFNKHLFATANAVINSLVALLLLAGLWAAKNRQLALHKNLMLGAIVLSVLFLLSYICHHLFAGSTKYGSVQETTAMSQFLYKLILFTHIPLAGIILPFILLAAYRALTGEYDKHKKLVRYTWPLWFYVAVSGVVVYLMISPDYR